MSDLAIGLRVLGGQLESFGQALVDRIVPLEGWTAALLGAAVVLDRVLARRARASLRIALYAPVALRVLIPLDWRIPVSSSPSVVPYLAPLSRIGASPTATLPSWQSPSWHALAAVAYLLVVAVLAGRAAVARLRLRRSLADARPVPGAHAGIPCPVVEHDELGPMAIGLLAPRVVLPRRLLAPGEEDSLACVLRHEGAHLRRRDAWLSLAMEVLTVVAWPVVPLWLAVARVRQLVELACDEAALAGADASERRRYGHALLDMAEWRAFAVAPLHAGELHFGSTLRTRIESLAAPRHWPLAAQALTLAFVPLAVLVACSGASPAPSAPPASATPASGAATAAASRADEDTDYGYRFDTDPARATVAPGTPAPPLLNADGRVSPEAIQRTIRGHFGALETCYAAGRRKDPRLAGTVVVKLVLGRDGAVTSSGAAEGTTLPDGDVVRCVAGELGKLVFPAGPGVLTIEYPIQFSP